MVLMLHPFWWEDGVVSYEYASLFSSVRIVHIASYWKFFLVHYVQVLCQSRLCKADHVCLTYLMLQRQLSHLNGRKLVRQDSELALFYAWRFTASQLVLAPNPLTPTTSIFFQLNTCSYSPYITSVWREVGPTVYNCCWVSPAQSFSAPSLAGLITIFYCLRFETLPTWRVLLNSKSKSKLCYDWRSVG
jgi:hypothetical protein